MKYYTTIIADDKLPINNCCKASVILAKSGNDKLSCHCCKKVIFKLKRTDGIIAIFCSQKCYEKCSDDFFPKFAELKCSPLKTNTSRKLLKCPVCNGISKRKGFTHTKDCKDNPVNIHAIEVDKKRLSRGVCTDCGGPPGMRRGFRHKSTCIRISKPCTIVCSSCGGKKRGRGFAHNPGCDAVKNRETQTKGR